MPEFLRERGDTIETARASDRYTAKDRSRALDVLRGCVLILRHPYDADPFSGAGNCWCGRHEASNLHVVVAAASPTPEDRKPE